MYTQLISVQRIIGIGLKPKISLEKWKQSLSTTPNMDRRLFRQKSCQKLSVMKTKKNAVSRKVVCFGILIHVLSCH
jgi:hypothetical protein